MQICKEDILKTVLLFIIVSLVKCQTDSEETNERAERLAEMMKHDGVERVVELTQKNIKSLLKKYNIIVVLFHTHNNDTNLRQDKYSLEVIKSILLPFASVKQKGKRWTMSVLGALYVPDPDIYLHRKVFSILAMQPFLFT